MAYLGKQYKYVRSENFEEFVNSCGLSEEQAKGYINFKPCQKLMKDGDRYVYTTTSDQWNRELVFKSGVEFDERIGDFDSKTVITVDGNVMTQVQKFDDGKVITFKREFNGDDLVVTITNSSWDGVAKRFYKV